MGKALSAGHALSLSLLRAALALPPGAYRCIDRPALLRAPTPARAAAVVNRRAVLRRPFHPSGTLGPVLPLPAADPCLGAHEDGSHPALLMLCAALSIPLWLLCVLGWLPM